MLPPPTSGGRPRSVNLRTILDGIFHVLHGGCQWRLLPRDYDPWSTVDGYVRAWRMDGTWERVQARLRVWLRRQLGRQPTPSAALLDGQSVKTSERGGPHGDDGGEKAVGAQTASAR